jgi:hypothetical protein
MVNRTSCIVDRPFLKGKKLPDTGYLKIILDNKPDPGF